MKNFFLTLAALLTVSLATNARAADDEKGPAENATHPRWSKDEPGTRRTGSGGMYDCGSSLSMRGRHGAESSNEMEASKKTEPEATAGERSGDGPRTDAADAGGGEPREGGHM